MHTKYSFSIILFLMWINTLFGASTEIFHTTLDKKGWYTSDSVELKNQLETLIKNAIAPKTDTPIAIIMPHAGYAYSGKVMAATIKTIQDNEFDRIIILGPSHYVHLENQIAVLSADYIQTPLGKIAIDKNATQELLKYKGFINAPDIHPNEHSVQIEIPWVQIMSPKTPIVPLVVGQLDPYSVIEHAEAIKRLITPKTLVLISSDFTHYGASFNYVPFDTDIEENIQKLDSLAVNYIIQKDLNGFQSFIQNTRAIICGEMPIQLLLALLPTHSVPHVIGYQTSGKLMSNWTHSVSYVGLAVTGNWKEDSLGLSYPELFQEGDALLKYARKTLELHVRGKSEKNNPPKLHPALNKKMSAFVTLKKNGELRGCIGSIFPTQYVIDEIKTQAINAGMHDSRFTPVTLSELKECKLEISILTPIQPIASYKDIRLGKNGILFKKGNKQAVFLPQVAIEQGWSLTETLSALSKKAGLDANDWQSNAEFFVFETLIFEEK